MELHHRLRMVEDTNNPIIHISGFLSGIDILPKARFPRDKSTKEYYKYSTFIKSMDEFIHSLNII